MRNKNLMLHSDKTKICHIEFTSKCNLRCIYCAINQPGYTFYTLSPETIEELIELIISRRVNIVSVNGHGETTTFPKWQYYCDRLIKEKIPLHIISNFAKPFSDEEIATLVQFRDIEISCDTSFPDLYRTIRRNGKLETIENNLKKIFQKAKEYNIAGPTISFSTVVSDQTVFGLFDLTKYAINLGVSYFNFCNLVRHPDIESDIQLNHVTTLPPDKLLIAKNEIEKSFAFLHSKNINFDYYKGLIDSINDKLNAKTASEQNIPKENSSSTIQKNILTESIEPKSIEVVKKTKKYSGIIKNGQTRNCLDPWHFMQIEASGNFLPCCWHSATGFLDSVKKAGNLFNNSAIKSLRWNLLSGNLDSHCTQCPSRGLINIYKYNLKVFLKLFNQEKNLQILFSFLKIMFLKRYRNIKYIYSTDWYDLEENLLTNEKWRWTSKRSTCFFKTNRNFILIEINGNIRANEKNLIIRLYLNEQEIDCFSPREESFFRSILIERKIYPASEGMYSLAIDVNKTFVPSEINSDTNDHRELGVQIRDIVIKSLSIF